MAATNASRNHQAEYHQPPLSISPHPSSAHRRLAASACSSSPPPVPSAERCAARRARRRSGPPPASCDDTTPERPPPLPPAPSLGRAARHAGRRCTNAAGARHGPATAPARLLPPPSRRFVLAYSCSSDGRAHRPQAQGGTKHPPPSPREMRAAGRLSFFSLFLFPQFSHMIY